MPPTSFQEDAKVIENRQYRGDYYRITFHSPRISAQAQPGQFVDLLVPSSPHLMLRRPFSIFDVDPDSGSVALIFKCVGAGTRVMAGLRPNADVNLLGPLGKGFPAAAPGQRLVVVAGGYGCAATYLLAKHAAGPGVVCLGGRTAADVLLREEFEQTAFDVRISTDDGSLGQRGLVTDLLEAELGNDSPAVYACGPNPMLRAVAETCARRQLDAAVSVDMPMCCGVGACFSCVVKRQADNANGWEYVRSCREGPVFMASQLLWNDESG